VGVHVCIKFIMLHMQACSAANKNYKLNPAVYCRIIQTQSKDMDNSPLMHSRAIKK